MNHVWNVFLLSGSIVHQLWDPRLTTSSEKKKKRYSYLFPETVMRIR